MIIELYGEDGKIIRKYYTNARAPRNAAKKYASYYPNTAYIIIRDYECSYRYDYGTANEPKKLWRKV